MLQCIFVFEWHLRYQSCYCLICWSYFWFQNLSVFKITKLSGKMFNICRTLEDLTIIIFPEAVTQRCSVTKVFLKILQNSQENNCARVSFLIKMHVYSCEFLQNFYEQHFLEHLWWLLLSMHFCLWASGQCFRDKKRFCHAIEIIRNN